MKFLVTGGAGFIGSHLAQRLVSRGDEVVVLDDLSTGRDANLEDLRGHGGFSLVVGSALDSALVGRLVADCDHVVHLAAAVGVRLIVERPVHTIVTNVEATRVVLDAASRRRTPVLLASSSEVYGKADRVPFEEEDDLHLGPTRCSRWSYACSKAMDEWLALAFHREHGVPVRIVRLFNTVGPRQTDRYGMVLPTFARQALAGEPLTVHGSGEQARCFAHVEDVALALVLLSGCAEAVGTVVNVGADEEVSIGALAERVRDAAGSSSPIVRVPYREVYGADFEDMRRRVPSLARLERLTGFRPARDLDGIVADVLEDRRSGADASGAAALAGTPFGWPETGG